MTGHPGPAFQSMGRVASQLVNKGIVPESAEWVVHVDAETLGLALLLPDQPSLIARWTDEDGVAVQVTIEATS